jgi:hypothetical protein
MKTKLIVSSGQYETAAQTITVTHQTWAGLCRRITQLENEHAVYGDNHAGWLPANVALADKADEWGDNQIIGGRWGVPANGWLELESSSYGPSMTYRELRQRLGL